MWSPAVAPQWAGSRVVAESPTRVVVVAEGVASAGDGTSTPTAAAAAAADDDGVSGSSGSADNLRPVGPELGAKGATAYRRRSLYY